MQETEAQRAGMIPENAENPLILKDSILHNLGEQAASKSDSGRDPNSGGLAHLLIDLKRFDPTTFETLYQPIQERLVDPHTNLEWRQNMVKELSASAKYENVSLPLPDLTNYTHLDQAMDTALLVKTPEANAGDIIKVDLKSGDWTRQRIPTEKDAESRIIKLSKGLGGPGDRSTINKLKNSPSTRAMAINSTEALVWNGSRWEVWTRALPGGTKNS